MKRKHDPESNKERKCDVCSTPEEEVLVRLGHKEENWKTHQARHDRKRKIRTVVSDDELATRLAAKKIRKPRNPKLALRKRLEYAESFAMWQDQGGDEEQWCALFNVDKRDLRRYVKAARKDAERLGKKLLTKLEREKQLNSHSVGSGRDSYVVTVLAPSGVKYFN